MWKITCLLVLSFFQAVFSSSRFYLNHDASCQDQRSLRDVLSDSFQTVSNVARKKRSTDQSEISSDELLADGPVVNVPNISFAAFHSLLKQNAARRSRRNDVAGRRTRREALLSPPPQEGPNVMSEEDFEGAKLSALPKELRRDAAITLLDLLVAQEQLKTKAGNGEGGEVPRQLSGVKAQVSEEYLEHLEVDIVNNDILSDDRVFELAHNLPCLAIPPEKPVQKHPLYFGDADSYLEQQRNAAPHEVKEKNLWYLEGGSTGGVNALTAWNCTPAGNKRIVVAVIDTGCSMHPDLERSLCKPGEKCAGYDFADGDNNPFDEDLSLQHGTAVSGFVSATPNNHYGVVGLCPQCRVACYKTATGGQLSLDAILRSIDHILGNNKSVKITNHSYSGGLSDTEKLAHRKMRDAGILNVMAAGNTWQNLDNLDQGPTTYGYDNAIVVGGTGEDGGFYPRTTWGPKTVHVMAPGYLVTAIGNTLSYPTGEKITSGTSFACPITAGVAGYLWSMNPDLTYKDVRKLILENVRKVKAFKGYCETGGIVDLGNAVQALKNQCSRQHVKFPVYSKPTRKITQLFAKPGSVDPKALKRIAKYGEKGSGNNGPNSTGGDDQHTGLAVSTKNASLLLGVVILSFFCV